jgi:hypothetical protein
MGMKAEHRSLAVLVALLTAGIGALGCGPGRRASEAPAPGRTAADAVAEPYVKLVLALGVHDPDYVDAFYGPPEWKEEAATKKLPLVEIRAGAEALLQKLGAAAGGAEAPEGADELAPLRHEYLRRHLEALVARVDILGGQRLDFDAESKALYGAVAPQRSEADFRATLDRLERLLPGKGALIDRYEAFRKAFIVPIGRLDATFQAAISACRERTARHIPLPPGESFRVEYVTDKPWSAYNWYQGGFTSLIQVNTSLPVYMGSIIDLACHEGYPGHHVYNALLEQHLVKGRGWIEYTVYPLFSPESLIAEGSAEYGIDLAFPETERLAFEQATLYPLAGIDVSRAAKYSEVQSLVRVLKYAPNEAARLYLSGHRDAAATADWLMRFALVPRERAEQMVRFIDRYRTYVINYNLGQDLVRGYVDAKAGDGAAAERCWQVFGDLLATPRLPGHLE